jgi:hypothetical protein
MLASEKQDSFPEYNMESENVSFLVNNEKPSHFDTPLEIQKKITITSTSASCEDEIIINGRNTQHVISKDGENNFFYSNDISTTLMVLFRKYNDMEWGVFIDGILLHKFNTSNNDCYIDVLKICFAYRGKI